MSRILAAVLLVLGLAGISAADEQTTAPKEKQKPNSFSQLTEGERFWWLQASVLSTATVIGQYDKEKSECVTRWYRRDKAYALKHFEETLSVYTYDQPQTVVFIMLTKLCGPLAPSTAR